MKILTVILTLLITANVFTFQKSDLEVVFNEYLDATNKKDVDSQVAHLYPKQFQYYPKENVVKAFEMMKYVENLQFGNQKLISISEIYEKKNIKYALITFSLELLLDLSEFKNTERNNQPLNNKAIYKLEEDLICKITFEFSEKGIKVTQESDDYNSGCGFGHAVKADGFFNKVSSEIPILKDPLTDEILD